MDNCPPNCVHCLEELCEDREIDEESVEEYNRLIEEE